MNPKAFIKGYIETHEGGLSLDKDDTGNWLNGVLVGSKFGVTGAVLAKTRKTRTVTPAEMAALTLDEAVDIGLDLFYAAPHFHLLPWNQVTASIVDMGWGAGPVQAVKLMQRMIAVADDGQIGLYTARAYQEFVSHDLAHAAQEWASVRNAFYEQIIRVRPTNAKYRKGWQNRTASFLPGTKWWKAFEA